MDRGGSAVLNSRALTKIQTLILITMVIVAGLVGVVTYVLMSGQDQSSDTIKIGILADLYGQARDVWQGAVLASEQVNAEGGLLGRQIEVIGEDTDIESGVDPAKINSAMTRLLTYHKVDFLIGIAASEGFMIQELIAQHKKIFFEIGSNEDAYTQRVLDDYDSYKYYFRVMFNATSIFQGMTDSLLFLREQTGFNKIGYLGVDLGYAKNVMEGLDYVLPEVHGFDLVYKGSFPLGTVDFTSYFAAAEAAGVEVMLPLIVFGEAVPFVKEYHARQSPMVIYGGVRGRVSDPEGWEITDGKCEYVSSAAYPMTAGYPLTSKTLPAREAYIDRWDEHAPGAPGSAAYDVLRYILPDAIRRAGTLEVDAVIQALERTSIETTNARNFVFTSSHDVMKGENPNDPEADYMLVFLFQWQNGKQVPVYPKKIMEEAGATYKFPPWPGPWD